MGSENKICFLFRSTHPRRVWHSVLFCSLFTPLVSIHTPTKGVTGWSLCFFWSRLVSIHTPTKGVTAGSGNIVRFCKVSIHTPTKGVTPSCKVYRHSCEVSIHTPTKGVTVALLAMKLWDMFQSTHPRRVWLGFGFTEITFSRFQSTHPRRVWRMVYTTSESIFCFNPHTHEGCDRAYHPYIPV